ncbi:MAG: branched-chain amino acid ABC transporter permease [Firmicutes bacterium]|nr:branched-chain amino acid ABC transporter permease [Bacillota bacterium]
MRKRDKHIWVILGLIPALAVLPHTGLVNPYLELVLMYIGINIILTVGLNLVNGYMGEFSVGHAAFMAIGAYASSILTVKVIPAAWGATLFPLVVLAGGAAAALAGVVIAVPSFKTRGDYLAIVTLAFNMIIRSALENMEVIGGPRGFMGMAKLTNPAWVYVWTLIAVFGVRNFVYTNYGRGVLSIREDEVASALVSVDTRKCKVLAFVLSSFFAGVAGALFAHLLQFINPRSFTILKSTEVLVMVYLGGVGSIWGSILGAAIFTVLLELLRPLMVWRWVVGPLMLVALMLFRPTGIMGLREHRWFLPGDEDMSTVEVKADVAA